MGSNANGAHQAPRLASGGIGYSAWRPNMDVFLQRNGAEGIHQKPLDEAKWRDMSQRSEEWAAEALEAAMALVLGSSSSIGATASSASAPTALGATSSTTLPISAEMKAGRLLVSATVERSRRVFGILWSSLPEELRAQAGHIAPGWAYGLWHWLETKFQSTEEDSVGEMLGRWSSLRQDEGQSFDAYRAEVNKLAALLEHAKEKPSARMYAHTLLDRLLPRYKAAVLALKASGQLKDAVAIVWDTIAAFINAHEREEARIGADEVDKAMGAWKKTQGAWNKPPTVTASAAGSAGSAGPRGPRSLADVQCFNCNKFGHFARNCSEPKKSARPAAAAAAAVAPVNGGESHDKSPPAGKHKASSAVVSTASRSFNRFETLADNRQELKEAPRGLGGRAFAIGNSKVITPTPATAIKPAQARRICRARRVAKKNIAAMSLETPVAADCAWGVDTMASLHVSGNRSLFVSGLQECSPVSVEVANGSFVTATHVGDVYLTMKTSKGEEVTIPIRGVHFHERFSANLLSWNALKRQKWELHSSEEATFVLTPGRQHKVVLDTRSGVAMMDCKGNRAHAVGTSPSVSPNATGLLRLHETLGHIGFDRMMRLIKEESTVDLPKISATDAEVAEARRLVLDCKACTQGKGTRTDFGHRGVDKGQGPGEVLCMDTFFVPMVREGREWLEYGLIVTDAFTSYRWFKQLDTKDQATDAVIDIVMNAQTQFSCKVKRLCADGGGEFVNKALESNLKARGIELRYPPARTQQLNGLAENAVRSVKDGTRTLMVHSWAPNRFWAWASKHATFVWNRTHVSRHTGKTPCEVFFGRKPSAKHWGVFGCDAFFHVPKKQRAVFAPKMERCIYLGHDATQNCGSVYVMRTKKIVQTRDLAFRPTSFTHCAALAAGDAQVEALLASTVDGAAEMQIPSRPESEEAQVGLQGGLETPVVDEDTEEEEFDVERVLAQRKHRKLGKQYLVKWDNGETTWEPAVTIEEDTPLLVKEFQESDELQAPRRSKRNQPVVEESKEEIEAREPAGATVVSGSEDSEQESPSATAQAHMAMSALRNWQSPVEHVNHQPELKSAVCAGVGLLEQRTPNTYREALASPDAVKWTDAMQKEMDSCAEKQVWSYVKRSDLPRGANILPAKWVYKIKTDENGAVIQFKARITPKGFRQKEGQDYFEVYARTGMYKSMRIGLSLAAKWDYEVDQLDVPTAFLNADVQEDIFMEIPEGFRDGREDMVCKVHKSLYGLKQAPRNWYLLVSDFLKASGFRATVSDPCLFFCRSSSGRLILVFLFVDDFQVYYHRDDTADWDLIKAKLVDRFQTKDMGASKWILGMRIQRNRVARTITLDQELYVTKALEKYGLAECKVAETPEAVGACDQQSNEKPLGPSEHQRYMEIVGTLMYAAISTRLDIAHAVHYLASHMLAPTQLHVRAAERVLRYLAGTRGVGLSFGAKAGATAMGDSRGHGERQQLDVCAFADADWAGDKLDRKSITGWVAKLNGDPISWSSKKQRTVALSTCEAELYAEAAAIQEVLWLRGLMKELRLQSNTGSVVHGDNQAAIAVTKNGIRSDRTKHVDIKYHFVTESVEQGEVVLKWVPTTEQQADIFTKALGAPVFLQFRRQLMTQ